LRGWATGEPSSSCATALHSRRQWIPHGIFQTRARRRLLSLPTDCAHTWSCPPPSCPWHTANLVLWQSFTRGRSAPLRPQRLSTTGSLLQNARRHSLSALQRPQTLLPSPLPRRLSLTVPHSRNVAALKPDAAPDAALALVAATSTPLTVLVGHLPNLHQIATNLGIVIGADAFAPCGGVVLEANGNGGWMLAHHIVPEQEKKDWWRHGVSVHIRADETGCEDVEPVTQTAGHKCPCTECTCGPDCKCAPGQPGCDPCSAWQKAKS
jgi:hypothetical protein